MNVLLNKFPQKIKIANEIYDINSDFRNCLKIIMAYEDDELTINEKHYIMLKRLYGTIPKNIEEATEKGILFLDCGKKEENNPLEEAKRVYSFSKDSEYIYSAINQTHNVDLERARYLHWWKFVFFFMDVNKDCTLSCFISLRDKKNKKKLNKEERAFWINMRNLLDLDYTPEPTDDESDFMKLWNNGN